jgi:plastocyanin
MSKPRPVRVLPLIAAAALLAGCGSDDETKTVSPGGGVDAGAASGGALTVKETDFKLDPANLKITDAGGVTVTVTNDGQTTHALEIEGQGVEKKTGDIAAGSSAKLTVTLKAGKYEMYCPIDGHKKLGMEGTITVGSGGSSDDSSGSGGSGGGETTSSGSSDDSGY